MAKSAKKHFTDPEIIALKKAGLPINANQIVGHVVKIVFECRENHDEDDEETGQVSIRTHRILIKGISTHYETTLNGPDIDLLLDPTGIAVPTDAEGGSVQLLAIRLWLWDEKWRLYRRQIDDEGVAYGPVYETEETGIVSVEIL
jgi:hypothetical protein